MSSYGKRTHVGGEFLVKLGYQSLLPHVVGEGAWCKQVVGFPGLGF
jgi:hypothetical protein